eukprot:jgi/Picsp_1/197/NSC_00196-R1_enolase-phosphatase e1
MVEEAKHLVAELCTNLYQQGHVSGTGGGISIKVGDRIVMAPSGVQKERMVGDDMFVLDDKGEVIHTPPAKPAPHKPPKLSECAPLFMSAYDLRQAGAVLHGHSMNAMLATIIHPEKDEFTVTHLEMIKGIAGHGFYDGLTIPIIENTARECELTDRLRAAIEKYPRATAVLVRRHGVYVWGDTWIQAKTQFECYEYLFEAAVKMHQMGLDASRPLVLCTGNVNGLEASANILKREKKRQRTEEILDAKFVVLDIEGTVAPMSFVAETLFPYAKSRLWSYFEEEWGSKSVVHDIDLLKEHAKQQENPFPASSASKEEIVKACVGLCEADMKEDKKTTALKSVQGHIWTSGFSKGVLKAPLFSDVPSAIVGWHRQGIKTYIYSSGSRQAQRDLFGHTTVGDLRPYLQGYFDTSSGPKVEAASYENIALSLGADDPSDILFFTDNIKEAQAADEAGWKVVVTDRPGNQPLPSDSSFKIVQDFNQL